MAVLAAVTSSSTKFRDAVNLDAAERGHRLEDHQAAARIRARWRSFTSSLAMTTSNTPLTHRNQTGETARYRPADTS